MVNEYAIIPQFQAIFEQVEPSEELVKQMATEYSIEEQERLFSAFREIIQDELSFVMLVFRIYKQAASVH